MSLLATLMVAMSSATGGGTSPGPSPRASASPNPSPSPSASPTPSASPSASPTPSAIVQRLSLQQLAGQRIVYSFAGLSPPASLLSAIRAGEAGGVIFFANNISSTRQLRGVVGELQRASRASPVHMPLLMLVDQEGGQVRRLPGAPALSEKEIGQSPRARALARAAGTGAGRNLRAAGLNVNLAPVLDVYRRPGDFIDEFQRSYSANPATVASLGAGFVAAQQRTGVAGTAKHFPGLGSAARGQDTDARPVVLRLRLTALRTVDERPYRSAIAAGVKLVMTSWAIYPALDRRRPAGLSSAVIGGELRRRLGFRGVTITDALGAGALTPFGGTAKRAELAASAGADLILCSVINPSDDSPTQGATARRALATALAHHRISLAAARQAATRILALRAKP